MRATKNISPSPRTFLFNIELIPELDGRWSVDIPDLPGCTTWGSTREEALTHAHEAILAYLEGLKILGKPLPTTISVRQAVTVAVTI